VSISVATEVLTIDIWRAGGVGWRAGWRGWDGGLGEGRRGGGVEDRGV